MSTSTLRPAVAAGAGGGHEKRVLVTATASPAAVLLPPADRPDRHPLGARTGSEDLSRQNFPAKKTRGSFPPRPKEDLTLLPALSALSALPGSLGEGCPFLLPRPSPAWDFLSPSILVLPLGGSGKGRGGG